MRSKLINLWTILVFAFVAWVFIFLGYDRISNIYYWVAWKVDGERSRTAVAAPLIHKRLKRRGYELVLENENVRISIPKDSVSTFKKSKEVSVEYYPNGWDYSYLKISDNTTGAVIISNNEPIGTMRVIASIIFIVVLSVLGSVLGYVALHLPKSG